MVRKMRYAVARAVVKNIKNGSSIYQACQAAGVNPATFWKWRQENPKFGLFIRYVLDSRTQIVEDAMYQNALKGNVTAQIFWLKNKAGWKDFPALVLNTGPNVTTPHAVIFTSLKEECQPTVKDECPRKRV